MKYAHTQPRLLRQPEVVLNLWAYADEAGYVMRIAGKAYVLDGDDAAKLAVLRQLSATDFLSAVWEKVPAGFTILGPDGQKMRGVAHASMVSDPNAQLHLFGPLMDALARTLPEQMRCSDDGYEPFRLELPEDPLTVTTVVIERPDGQLVPMVADRIGSKT